MKENSSLVDVAVLLIFFNRPYHTEKTFNQIKKARPSKLFLYQDGARNEQDFDKVQRCRDIVMSNVDWNCEVYTMFQEKNYGCDPSEYIAQKWMFSHVDKGIIIEDDDVMSVSFFRYCKDLLDKYEFDPRVAIICGMNHLGIYDACPYDYLFSKTAGSIWGWATWKRVVDQWDSSYAFITDKYTVNLLEKVYGNKNIKNFILTCKKHFSSGREHYESILGSTIYLNSAYLIVPRKNMTHNISVGEDTTHSVKDKKILPRAVQKIIQMQTYELDFPMRHPQNIIPDLKFDKKVRRLLDGSWFVRFFKLRTLEYIVRKVIFMCNK